jgi:DNA-directed RNA polymerase II subunit RPB1
LFLFYFFRENHHWVCSGDEMNLHVVQSYEAVAELEQLMSVEANLLNAQNNRPVIGVVQDAALASSLLTQTGVLVNRMEMMQLCTQLGLSELPPPAILRPEQMWTGHQAFSMLLPADLNMTQAPDIIVRKGQLLRGMLTKQHLGPTSGGIIHVIALQNGPRRALDFVDECQLLTNEWLKDQGFGVSMSDCVVDSLTQSKVDKALADCEAHMIKVEKMGRDLGMSFEMREQHAEAVLSNFLGSVGTIVSKSKKPSSIRDMINAGSKGSLMNLAQIMGSLGQQFVQGARIMNRDCPERRMLSCIHPTDTGIRARGFVVSNYRKGLDPVEMYYHSMSGREGVVDSSTKTAITGYLQRRLIKANESLCVAQDRSVRDPYGNILDLLYGGDGCDASLLEKVQMHFLTQDVGSAPFGGAGYARFQALVKECLRHKVSLLCPKLDTTALLPLNPERLLLNTAHVERWTETWDASIADARLDKLLCELSKFGGTLFFRCALSYHLRWDAIRHLGPRTFGGLCEHVMDKYHRALVDPGEMVGNLAAECLGEPSTQMTLNSHRAAGHGSLHLTMGIPRLNEIINGQPVIRTPCCTLALHEPYCYSKAFIQAFLPTLNETRLRDVLLGHDIIHNPNLLLDQEQDQELLDLYKGAVFPPAHSNYVVRLELNSEKLRPLGMSITTVVRILRSVLPNNNCYHLIASQPHSSSWIIRLRMAGLPSLTTDKSVTHLFLRHLLDVHITGVPGFHSATLIATQRFDTGREEFQIQIMGSDLRALWAVELCDFTRTHCNHLPEIARVLGMEATAAVLFEEIRQVMSSDGGYVDPRHIMLCVLAMTRTGRLMPLTRHGLNKQDHVGYLVRASFEKVGEILFDAGFHGEENQILGVSDSILVGQHFQGGTGQVRLQQKPQTVRPSYADVIQTHRSDFARDPQRYAIWHSQRRELGACREIAETKRRQAEQEIVQTKRSRSTANVIETQRMLADTKRRRWAVVETTRDTPRFAIPTSPSYTPSSPRALLPHLDL